MGRVVLHLRPQALNGDVHEPGIAQVLVVPDAVQQELACEHSGRSSCQLEQEAELGRREVEILPGLARPEPAGSSSRSPATDGSSGRPPGSAEGRGTRAISSGSSNGFVT